MIISKEIKVVIMQLYLKKLWLKLDKIQKIEGNSSMGGDSFPKGADTSKHASIQLKLFNPYGFENIKGCSFKII
jgi:hypothetical protein